MPTNNQHRNKSLGNVWPHTLLWLMLIAAMGCSNGDEPSVSGNQQLPIVIAASDDAMSRASAPLSSDYTMYVHGIRHNGESHKVYLDDVEFSLNSSNLWAADYYWPQEGSMDFAVYALLDPSSHKPEVARTLSDNHISSLALDFGTSLDGTEDILYSNRTAEVGCPTSAPVEVNLSHALARLNLNIKAMDDATYSRLKIKSIEVSDVYLSGALSLRYDSDGIASPSWTAKGTSGYSKTNGLDFSDNNPISFSFNMLPRLSGTKLKMIYIIENGNDGDAYTTPELEFVYSFPSSPWKEGYEYTYNLNCTLHEFTMESSVAYWRIEIDAFSILKDWEDGGTITETPGQ